MSNLVALVTGSSTGIGRATVRALAVQGMQVFGTVRDARDIESVVDGADSPLSVRTVIMDVRDETSILEGVASVVSATGRIDVLVNNAGVAYIGAVETLPQTAWDELFDVNVFGCVRTIRAVLPYMRRQERGLIVNVSSMNGRMAPPYAGAYAASKYALEGLSEALAIEVATFGIRVTVIAPGRFRTAIFGKLDRAGLDRSGVYGPQEHAVLAEAVDGSGEASDPSAVADVIADLAADRRSGFRHPVGTDAVNAAANRRAAATDDDWLELVRCGRSTSGSNMP